MGYVGQSIEMLGRDYAHYGQVATWVAAPGPGPDDRGDLEGLAAAAISVGADRRSPSLQYKGCADTPNEDALCVVDEGRRVGLAVADAHFGHYASHVIIHELLSLWNQGVPADEPGLQEQILSLQNSTWSHPKSATTLVAAVIDRERGQGFGISFGDSTAVKITAAGEYRALNPKNECYVRPRTHRRLPDGAPFAFEAGPGDLVILHTDGVDECHYRMPATSVQPHHLVATVRQQPTLGVLAQDLVELALAGVDNHPGGQDNIAVALARA